MWMLVQLALLLVEVYGAFLLRFVKYVPNLLMEISKCYYHFSNKNPLKQAHALKQSRTSVLNGLISSFIYQWIKYWGSKIGPFKNEKSYPCSANISKNFKNLTSTFCKKNQQVTVDFHITTGRKTRSFIKVTSRSLLIFLYTQIISKNNNM